MWENLYVSSCFIHDLCIIKLKSNFDFPCIAGGILHKCYTVSNLREGKKAACHKKNG